MTNSSRSLNELRRKRCQKRQKAHSGVSYSPLNKHRLVNLLEGYIDETGLCHKTHELAYRQKFLQSYRKAVWSMMGRWLLEGPPRVRGPNTTGLTWPDT